MGKYKKILLVVLTVSLLLVTVCLIPAAAVVNSGAYNQLSLPILKPELTGNNTVLELMFRSSDGSYRAVMFNFVANPSYANTGSRFDIIVSLNAVKVNGVFMSEDVGTMSGMYVRDDGYFSYQSILYSQSNESDFYFSFAGNTTYNTIISYKVYGNYGTLEVNQNVGTEAFDIIYGADNVQYTQMQQLINSVNGLGSISGDITANQNENTDKIIEQQQENTDKILNGGSDEPPYSAPDTSGTDEVHEKEAYIFENTTEGRDTAVSVFNNVGAVFNDSSFANGMLFVSSFFNEFFGISWLNSIGSVSLALGAFAFVIGSVVVIGRNVVSRRKGGD